MTFASRQDAGLQLGQHLLKEGVQADRVLGLPRGGVVVAAEVSKLLHLRLGAMVVRKIGHPRFREFAIGALAENHVMILDRDISDSLLQSELTVVLEEETKRLARGEAQFHPPQKAVYCGESLLLVDDGLATGATMEAGVLSARKQGAGRVIVAVPIASPDGVRRVSKISDGVISLQVDPRFRAVGLYYTSFEQTTDREVCELLRLPSWVD